MGCLPRKCNRWIVVAVAQTVTITMCHPRLQLAAQRYKYPRWHSPQIYIVLMRKPIPAAAAAAAPIISPLIPPPRQIHSHQQRRVLHIIITTIIIKIEVMAATSRRHHQVVDDYRSNKISYRSIRFVDNGGDKMTHGHTTRILVMEWLLV